MPGRTIDRNPLMGRYGSAVAIAFGWGGARHRAVDCKRPCR